MDGESEERAVGGDLLLQGLGRDEDGTDVVGLHGECAFGDADGLGHAAVMGAHYAVGVVVGLVGVGREIRQVLRGGAREKERLGGGEEVLRGERQAGLGDGESGVDADALRGVGILCALLGKEDDGEEWSGVGEHGLLDDAAEVVEHGLAVVGIKRGGEACCALYLHGDVDGGVGVGGDGDLRGKGGCENGAYGAVEDLEHGSCFRVKVMGKWGLGKDGVNGN